MRQLAASVVVLVAFGLGAPLRASDPVGPPAPAEPKPAVEERKPDEKGKLVHRNHETIFETDDFLIALQNRIQFRYERLTPDASVQLPGTEQAGDSIGTFRIRRAKTKLEGWFWKKELNYELQIGWAGSDSTGGSSVFSGLEDARLTWDALGTGSLKLTIGQFKVPFGRQEVTSSERMQFVDRSILSGEFTRSRDVGLMVSGALLDHKLEYSAGVFNGNGRNKAINDNSDYQYDARVMFQPFGEVKYSEGDFESADRPLLAVAGEFEHNSLFNATNATDLKSTIFGTDVVFKFKGLSVYGEFFSRERTPETGDAFHSDGWLLQAGYFVIRDKLELAFRYAAWDPSDARSDDDQSEIGGAISYYLLKHNFKVQADYRQVEDQTRSAKQRELRVQSQFVF